MTSRPPSAPPSPAVYLVAIDASEAGHKVVKLAAGLAAGLGGPAELHVLHVITMPVTEGVPAFPSATELLEKGRALVDRACAAAAYEGRTVGHLAVGEPWREVLDMAERLRADLVIVGASEKNMVQRMLLGSVAEKIVRSASCPVLVVRPKQYDKGDVPSIEPPCPDCLEVQTKTERQELWCARHAAKHPHGRLHYEIPKGFGRGSMLIRP